MSASMFLQWLSGLKLSPFKFDILTLKKILKLRHNYNSPRLTEKLFKLLLIS